MRRRARAALGCIRLNCRRRVHKRSRQQKRGLHSESQREWRGRLKGRRSQNRECRWDDWNSPRFPHNPRILCDEDAQNDAQAAREAEESQSFSREPADHGGEDAFKRKDHRSLCGRHVFLRPSQKKLCTGQNDSEPDDAEDEIEVKCGGGERPAEKKAATAVPASAKSATSAI